MREYKTIYERIKDVLTSFKLASDIHSALRCQKSHSAYAIKPLEVSNCTQNMVLFDTLLLNINC